MRFTLQQKLLLALWIVIGAYWCYALIVRHDGSTTVWLGFLTVALGILAQVDHARRNANR